MPTTKTKKVKAKVSLPYLITLRTSDQVFSNTGDTLLGTLNNLNPGRLKMPGLLKLETEGKVAETSLTMFQMRRIFNLKGSIKQVALELLAKRLLQNLK